jgi:hypothetical protein
MRVDSVRLPVCVPHAACCKSVTRVLQRCYKGVTSVTKVPAFAVEHVGFAYSPVWVQREGGRLLVL